MSSISGIRYKTAANNQPDHSKAVSCPARSCLGKLWPGCSKQDWCAHPVAHMLGCIGMHLVRKLARPHCPCNVITSECHYRCISNLQHRSCCNMQLGAEKHSTCRYRIHVLMQADMPVIFNYALGHACFLFSQQQAPLGSRLVLMTMGSVNKAN